MAGRRGGALPAPFDVRFASKVDASGGLFGCWTWFGALNDSGYGVILGDDRRLVYAHRIAYERAVGPIPAGLSVDHTCYNRACVNPAHLEAVTLRENIQRAWARKRAVA
jgi:hypothetical protein